MFNIWDHTAYGAAGAGGVGEGWADLEAAGKREYCQETASQYRDFVGGGNCFGHRSFLPENSNSAKTGREIMARRFPF